MEVCMELKVIRAESRIVTRDEDYVAAGSPHAGIHALLEVDHRELGVWNWDVLIRHSIFRRVLRDDLVSIPVQIVDDDDFKILVVRLCESLEYDVHSAYAVCRENDRNHGGTLPAIVHSNGSTVRLRQPASWTSSLGFLSRCCNGTRVSQNPTDWTCLLKSSQITLRARSPS